MDVIEYKCPCCGAALFFASDTQNMRCDSCGNTFDVAAVQQFSEAENEAKEESRFGWQEYGKDKEEWTNEEHMYVYTCPSCGGQIISDENTAATQCPYCDNNTIFKDRLSGAFRPDCIIPFKIEKDRAKKELEKFCKGKKLLPKEFWKQNRIEQLQGIYVPFWLFDCDSYASMQYRATHVTSWRNANYEYVRTEHYLLLRSGYLNFAKIPVDGSTKMADEYMEAIEPFDYHEAIDFHTAYLSGYLADKYDVDAEQSKPRANKRIENSVQAVFGSTTLGYTTVVPQSTVIQFDHGCIKYALLPVWMMNTTYQGKRYCFAMNGQTGKFVGELPVSRKRYWAWVGGLFIGFGMIFGLIATLL